MYSSWQVDMWIFPDLHSDYPGTRALFHKSWQLIYVIVKFHRTVWVNQNVSRTAWLIYLWCFCSSENNFLMTQRFPTLTLILCPPDLESLTNNDSKQGVVLTSDTKRFSLFGVPVGLQGQYPELVMVVVIRQKQMSFIDLKLQGRFLTDVQSAGQIQINTAPLLRPRLAWKHCFVTAYFITSSVPTGFSSVNTTLNRESVMNIAWFIEDDLPTADECQKSSVDIRRCRCIGNM